MVVRIKVFCQLLCFCTFALILGNEDVPLSVDPCEVYKEVEDCEECILFNCIKCIKFCRRHYARNAKDNRSQGCEGCDDWPEMKRKHNVCVVKYPIPRSCYLTMIGAAGATSLLAGPLIGLFGFGAGVSSGSLASLWQATMGGIVAKGGLFATLQSIGAAGFSYAGIALVSGSVGSGMYVFCKAIHLDAGEPETVCK